jgi:serine/threonine protein kinase
MNLIARKYTILNKIGAGAYGEVFMGKHIRKNEYVAIKSEEIMAGDVDTNNNDDKDDIEDGNNNINPGSMLKNEAKIYKYLPAGPGIAVLKWFGCANGRRYMVTTLLGKSIAEYKAAEFPRGMPLNKVYLIGIRLMHVIQHIHSSFLVHGDIKPDNILFGPELSSDLSDATDNTNPNTLHIIDFGLSRAYMTKLHAHVLPSNTFQFIGTPDYASIMCHNCQKPSRRDDMESIGYILLYLSTTRLPWAISESFDEVREKKEQFRKTIISIAPENQTPLIAYFSAIFALEYDSDPEYSKLCDIFS